MQLDKNHEGRKKSPWEKINHSFVLSPKITLTDAK
jgi:hypothetical protein